ncbi:Long-chain-fatty-acid--CoA ligase FadD15 [Sinobacterium norvegicum]|uniref:Long-chain-fatty-acid--CoA ligase FadD15 n=1 Tax=Sinobacterium norvegicum TaxID=1641715 RepID=A0ABM9AE96_9GAMM|nr:long-chain fatty acid--CoA ligase [Sinobacterium norvegicum]CAH0991247.1 Long-chain-fatty-acid--CoA ligase FadD15 [Sinobacterium norvegicum]
MQLTVNDHLTTVYRHKMSSQGEHIAQSQEGKQWSWQQIQQQADSISLGLLELGCEVQENIGIYADNSAQWSWIDIASMAIRAVPVPAYATHSQDQLAYVIDDAQIRVLFTGNQQQYDAGVALLAQCDSLEYIVAIDDGVFIHHPQHSSLLCDFIAAQRAEPTRALLAQRIDQASLDDIITLIYTSGTTGEPKGVILDYRNISAAIEMHRNRIVIDENDTSLSFLPLSHIFERAWTWYALASNCRVAYCRNPARIQKALVEVKPTVMCAVPRLYEKIYTQVISKAESAPRLKKLIFSLAFKIGNHCFERRNNNQTVGPVATAANTLADKIVFANIRQALGGNIRFMPSGGAALDAGINQFFQVCGLNVISGFGMTETCATVCCRDEVAMPMNSCGTPLPGIELKLGDNNELLIKGPTVMRGYYNKPQETAATLVDGWLKTGDAAKQVDGNIVITERLKDLMKTSNGKYVAPQRVEGKLIKEQLIEQITIIGDERQFVSALIVPAFEDLEKLAKQKGIEYKDRLELISHSDIVLHFKQRIEKMQSELAGYEKVKKFTLLVEEFTIAKNELTPTLKVKRKVILEKFKTEINAMYNSVKKHA